ncbi:MAG TPA: DUF1573 domain-containing protein [Pontiella sp.]
MKQLLTLCFFLLGTASAELEWATKKIELQVLPAQLISSEIFRFKNSGKKPVSIDSIKVSCGCISAHLQNRTFAAGASGELTIRFDLKGRTGPQEKFATVKTDDGVEVKLVITADVPETYEISPKMLRWPRGADEQKKSAMLLNPNKTSVRLLSIKSSNKLLPAELKTIREGFEYEVVVSRLPEAINARSVIRIQTEPPPGHKESKTLKLYVHAQ